MDPAASFLIGHATGKLLDRVGTLFNTHVVERWSRRRAEVFFEQFCTEIVSGGAHLRPDEIEARFEQIVEDDVCSEVLFDAYRYVALAKSKYLGPRIIALLAAQIIVERRSANAIEEAIYVAAENLTDEELVEAQKFVREQQQRLTPDDAAKRWFRIKWNAESFDSSWHQTSSISTAPLDLHEAFGGWAAKLKLYGLFSDDVQERQFKYQLGERRHSLDGGSVREVEWWIDVNPACVRLIELVERARAQMDSQRADRPPGSTY